MLSFGRLAASDVIDRIDRFDRFDRIDRFDRPGEVDDGKTCKLKA